MKKFYMLLVLLSLSVAGFAQRFTDTVDRGLVAVKVSNGVFVSWRVFGEEYYDVTYNLYRNGTKVNAKPLSVSNFTDASGSTSSTYTVAPVIDGVEQEKSAAVKVWSQQYIDIPMQSVINRNGQNVTADYTLNDVSLADVDGDGVSEFIVKRNSNAILDYTNNKHSFHRLECYNIKGKRLWYIDLGPNMVSGPDEQYDIIGYDWDMDGKAEVLLRGADNMIIHRADGTTENVGNMSLDSRNTLQSDANMAYTHTGNEFLLYLNGETAETYVKMAYPLPRLESGQTDLNAVWGDGYGHRSTKHFFAAPYLDGRRPSIFLGRGAYTIHKMVAFDVDPVTHQLTQRWRWNDPGGSWRGQGYHNFGIADVDMDGRDEIVFGSMVLDDNGKGLSTTGLGHGDAQHTSDFDPYRWGLEHFACNESQPAMNYRNATTSKIYYRLQSNGDDGRALCGNFTNEFPGAVGKSNASGLISTVADKPLPGVPGFDLNFRIYWDGDLCEEILNSPGTEREAKIDKIVGGGVNRIFTSSGCKMNNWSKNNPGATGDILGDWREEMVLRTGDNAYLRIYTTTTPTNHRIYTLWHDHQYRNAMVWQSIGYNQPPHLSYFLGELEGITIAPPPLTMTGRTEVANGGTIGTDLNGKHAIVCENNDMNVSIAEGASPRVMTFNVPSWVQGNNNNNSIKYTYYTHTVSGAGFTGNTRLVKQGDGTLILPKVDMTHTGNTDIWAGKVNFDGTMKNSSFWLNRFAELNSAGGQFRSIKMDYASVLRPGHANSKGEITTDTLALNFGSIVEIDIYNTGFAADVIKTKHISVEKKNWEYGPQYLTPVWRFKLQDGTELADGSYLIAEAATISGNIDDIKIEGTGAKKASLKHENGSIYLVIEGVRDASLITWIGNETGVWNYAADMNFVSDNNSTYFVENDKILFNNEAETFNVELMGDLKADSLFVDNTTAYTFGGSGKIAGNASLIKTGSGRLTITTDNTYTGGNRISGGTVSVSSLSNANQAYGNLGAVTTAANKFIIENGATLQTTAAVQMGSPIRLETEAGGIINNSHDFAMNKAFTGTLLTKRGSGWLKTYASGASLNRMAIVSGTVENHSGNAAKVVELQGGAINDMVGTSNEINIPSGKKGSWTTANRQNYSNTITGAGTITVYCATEKGNGWYATRTPLRLNTANFTGTLVPQATYAEDGRFTLDIALNLGKGAMDIPSGIYVQNSGKISTVGQLTGKGKIGAGCAFSNGVSVGANTWKVGNDEENFTWEGVFEGNAIFEKIGECRMTVKGANANSGVTRINAGSILLSGASAKLGTGSLTIAKGATLTGTSGSGGSLTNSSVTVNGTVHPGSTTTATSGNINFGEKNVTFNSGSTLVIGLRRCASKTNPGGSQIVGINKLTMKGTISAFLYEGYEPVEGDSMIIFEAKSFTGTPQFDLPELPSGFFWNTDRISEGLLFIGYDATAIESIPADTDVEVSVFTVGGSQIGSFTCPFGSVEAAFRQSEHPSGVYLLKITSPQGTITKKLLK